MTPALDTIYICQGRWYYDSLICLSWHTSMEAAQDWFKSYMAHCDRTNDGDYEFDRLQIQKLGKNKPGIAYPDEIDQKDIIYVWDSDKSATAATPPDAAAQR